MLCTLKELTNVLTN